ncbi:MAG: hypothetical protein IKG27_00060 [Bacilli bacterium]|nr:hypothetical protein [Bacilli bacterium]
MDLNERLEEKEAIQSLKKKIIKLQKQNQKIKENIELLIEEITDLEKAIDTTPLGEFGDVGLLTITHDDTKVSIHYSGNTGHNDKYINKCLILYDWVPLEELRKLSSFKEEGHVDYVYVASFLIDEYEKTYSKNYIKSDNKKQKSLIKKFNK